MSAREIIKAVCLHLLELAALVTFVGCVGVWAMIGAGY